MKKRFFVLPIMFLLLTGCSKPLFERTTIEPTDYFEWRVCTTGYFLDAWPKTCSLPVSYADALWWAEAREEQNVMVQGTTMYMDSNGQVVVVHKPNEDLIRKLTTKEAVN